MKDELTDLRLSIYCIDSLVPDSSHVLLLHGLTGKCALIDKSDFESLVNHKIVDIPLAKLVALARENFITSKSLHEEETMARELAGELHSNARAQHPGSFIFIPTYTCSFRCPYCFQSHLLHSEDIEVPNVLMTEEQCDAAFAIINKFRSRFPKSVYSHLLFGGEPLSAATKEIVSYILNRCLAEGDSLKAITNGYELDLFRELLGPDKISWLQVTLDGDKDYHDKRRFAAGRTPTFDKIVSNIEIALSLGVFVHVRVNVDKKNICGLEALQDRLDKIRSSGGYGEKLQLGLTVTHGSGVTDKTRVEISELVEEFSGDTTFYQNARTLLENLLDEDNSHPFASVSNCTSQLGTYIFDPRWDIYSCWEQAGKPPQRIGTYSVEGMNLDDIKLGQWHGRHPGSIDECGTCKYIFICGGGCAHYAEVENGSMYSNRCEGMKVYMPRVLGEAFKSLSESAI